MASIIESLTIASLAGIGIKLIFPEEILKILRRTVFRGKGLALAGNSSRWDSPEEMVKDPLFIERFCDIIAASIEENRPLLHVGYDESVAIPFEHETPVGTEAAPSERDTPVGWVTALPRALVNGASIHLAKLGENATGMVVSVRDVKHPAPLTNLLHMQLSYKLDFKCQSEIAVRVLGMGIGPDLGPLEGDLTKERGIISFLPQHAGGSTIIPLEP